MHGECKPEPSHEAALHTGSPMQVNVMDKLSGAVLQATAAWEITVAP